VARAVASSLAVGTQANAEQTTTYGRTGDPQAYDSFLMGRQYFYLYASRDENLKAREFFESAIKYDPDYALAYAMLGWTYTYEAINGWSDDRVGLLNRGLDMAQKANALDTTLPVAYFVSGFAYRGLGEYMKALVEAEKAIEYDPNYANAHLLLATLLYYAGRPEEGLKRVEQAMLINPHHPFNYTYHQGQALYILGRYDEAVSALEKAIASNPGAERVHVWLAAAYAQAGAIEDAQWEVDQIITMDPEFSMERIEKVFPFKDPADRERFIEGLLKAGLS
jgi:adenylate cyclase